MENLETIDEGASPDLAASLTHMWLLARVYASVDGQGRSLDELLIASRMLAHVRPNSRMYPFVTCEVTPAGKSLATSATGEGLLRWGLQWRPSHSRMTITALKASVLHRDAGLKHG